MELLPIREAPLSKAVSACVISVTDGLSHQVRAEPLVECHGQDDHGAQNEPLDLGAVDPLERKTQRPTLKVKGFTTIAVPLMTIWIRSEAKHGAADRADAPARGCTRRRRRR